MSASHRANGRIGAVVAAAVLGVGGLSLAVAGGCASESDGRTKTTTKTTVDTPTERTTTTETRERTVETDR